jgi:hypothetical protein
MSATRQELQTNEVPTFLAAALQWVQRQLRFWQVRGYDSGYPRCTKDWRIALRGTNFSERECGGASHTRVQTSVRVGKQAATDQRGTCPHEHTLCRRAVTVPPCRCRCLSTRTHTTVPPFFPLRTSPIGTLQFLPQSPPSQQFLLLGWMASRSSCSQIPSPDGTAGRPGLARTLRCYHYELLTGYVKYITDLVFRFN